MADDSKLKRTVRALVADVRQGVVGWAVLAAIPVIGAVLLAALGGDVPAWSLALSIALSGLLVAALIARYNRAFGRLEGLLDSAKKGRMEAERELAGVAPAGTSREPLLSRQQNGFLVRTRRLREDMEDRKTRKYSTSISQAEAIAVLAAEIRRYVGESSALEAIVADWDGGGEREIDDAITALGQLEGIVVGYSTAASTPGEGGS